MDFTFPSARYWATKIILNLALVAIKAQDSGKLLRLPSSTPILSAYTIALKSLPFATKNITYPKKKYFRIIFRLPFHDLDFFELI